MTACSCNCEVCSAHVEGGKNMPCDEVWAYVENSAQNVAVLTRVRMLCRDCDLARHFGRAGAIGFGAKALTNLARVNNMTGTEARKLQDEIMERWKRRSGLNWTVDVSADLLDRYPSLSVLVGLKGVAHP